MVLRQHQENNVYSQVIVGSVKTRKYSTFHQLASSGNWLPDEANWRNVEYFMSIFKPLIPGAQTFSDFFYTMKFCKETALCN